MKIVHLSVTVEDPERSAKILAELSNGQVESFRSPNMVGAFVCKWGRDRDELIEFLPNGYMMYPTDKGANFKEVGTKIPYNATHFQIRTDIPLEQIQQKASEFGCHHYLRASKRRGGPLYEVWIEEHMLVEFASEEIDRLSES